MNIDELFDLNILLLLIVHLFLIIIRYTRRMESTVPFIKGGFLNHRPYFVLVKRNPRLLSDLSLLL